MKKHLYLLALATAVALPALTSCDDGNDYPDVTVSVTLDGCYQQGNTLYVLQGDDLRVTSVEVVNNGNDRAIIGSVAYFWDNIRVGTSIVEPYGFDIDTGYLPVGNHLLQATATILATDYPVCSAYIAYNVVILPDESELPPDVIEDPVVQASLTSADD